MLLGTDIPVSSQVMTVHPDDALAERAHIDISVGGAVEFKAAFEEDTGAGEGGAGCIACGQSMHFAYFLSGK